MKVFLARWIDFIFNEVITHIPVHFIRKSYLRTFNRKISRTSKILMHVRLLSFWKLQLDERVVINQYCLLDCRQYRIHVGEDTDIGPYSRIWTLQHDPESVSHGLKGGDVRIGDHVWIASGAVVLPGINIGRGAVVASGAIVTRDVEERCVVAGIPAKKVSQRDNPLEYKLGYTPFLD